MKNRLLACGNLWYQFVRTGLLYSRIKFSTMLHADEGREQASGPCAGYECSPRFPERTLTVKPVVKSLLLKFRPAKKFCSGPAVGLVVLWLKADQHQGGTVTNARYGSDAPCDPERVKLLAGHRFNHPVQFFEVQAAVRPQSGKVERLQKHQHLGRCQSNRFSCSHDRLIKLRTDFNPHKTTGRQQRKPGPGFQPL
jgi:hypothetical protein